MVLETNPRRFGAGLTENRHSVDALHRIHAAVGKYDYVYVVRVYRSHEYLAMSRAMT